MKIEFRLQGSNLRIRRTGTSWEKADLRPLDPFALGFEIVGDGQVVGYEFTDLGALFPEGTLTLPFEEPGVELELESMPEQRFSLSEFLCWIRERSPAAR